jgi:DNA topoisomerase-2
MTLFDKDYKIKKYPTAQSIIDAYYPIRLEYYDKRRTMIINDIQFQLNRIKSKIRFVSDIMEDRIVIFKKKKAEIAQILELNGYPKYPNKLNIVKSLEINEPDSTSTNSNANAEDDSSASYNYLLSMPINSFTQEIINDLNSDATKLQNKLDEVNNKNAKQLWLDDIIELRKAYNEWMSNWYEDKGLKSNKDKITLKSLKINKTTS